MVERLTNGHHERLNHTETSHENTHKTVETKKPELKDNQEDKQSQLEALIKQAKERAKPAKEVTNDTGESLKSSGHYTVSRELKDTAFNRILNRTRKHMNPLSRTFSTLTHQPIVDKISDLGEKTIARPKSMLLAGILAFLGSLAMFYYSKNYGFSYNFLTVVALFFVGYLIGIFFEIVGFLLDKTKR